MANQFRREQRKMNKAHVASAVRENGQNVAKRQFRERPAKAAVQADAMVEDVVMNVEMAEEVVAVPVVEEPKEEIVSYSARSVKEIAENLIDISEDKDVSAKDQLLNEKYYIKQLMIELNHPDIRKNGGYQAKKGEEIDLDRAFKVKPQDIYAFRAQLEATIMQDPSSTKNLALTDQQNLAMEVSPAQKLELAKALAAKRFAKDLEIEKIQSEKQAAQAAKAAEEQAQLGNKLVASGILQKNADGSFSKAEVSTDKVVRGRRANAVRNLMQEQGSADVKMDARGELKVSAANIQKFEEEIVARFVPQTEESAPQEAVIRNMFPDTVIVPQEPEQIYAAESAEVTGITPHVEVSSTLASKRKKQSMGAKIISMLPTRTRSKVAAAVAGALILSAYLLGNSGHNADAKSAPKFRPFKAKTENIKSVATVASKATEAPSVDYTSHAKMKNVAYSKETKIGKAVSASAEMEMVRNEETLEAVRPSLQITPTEISMPPVVMIDLVKQNTVSVTANTIAEPKHKNIFQKFGETINHIIHPNRVKDVHQGPDTAQVNANLLKLMSR